MSSYATTAPQEATRSRPDSGRNPGHALISVVIPVLNEEKNLQRLVERLHEVLDASENDFEIILVDDGSSDRTWETIVSLHMSYPRLRGLRLSRNFGHQRALLAGLSNARGDAVICMDGDMQHPPEVLPQLIALWRDGYKVVLTRRHDTAQVSWFKRVTSKYFYRLFSAIAETNIDPGSSDFRLLDRRPLQELLKFQYGEPFLRGAVGLLGFHSTVLEFTVGERFAGHSKYTLKRMLRFARQGIVSHSTLPLRLGLWLGLILAFLTMCEVIYAVAIYFFGHTVPGWTSLVAIAGILFSMLFLIIGLIGFYLEDMHKLLKQRPDFIISQSTPPEPANES